MSSGSYFPPAVRQVEIAKQSGGKRKLGIPTVGDRVAQTVVKLLVELGLDRLFRTLMDTGLESQLNKWWRSIAGAAGI